MSIGRKTWISSFTSRAKRDISDIVSFIADREGPDMADTILNKFLQARDSLSELPDRGRIPPKLRRVNILSFREIQVPPYRVFYQIHKASHEVHIHLIADGRRNFSSLLKERLLTSYSRDRDK